MSFLDHMLENMSDTEQTQALDRLQALRAQPEPVCTCDPCCADCGHRPDCPANTEG